VVIEDSVNVTVFVAVVGAAVVWLSAVLSVATVVATVVGVENETSQPWIQSGGELEVGCGVLQESPSPSQLLVSLVSVSLAVLLLLGRRTVEVKESSDVWSSAEDFELVPIS
jgi:hypothetical protein